MRLRSWWLPVLIAVACLLPSSIEGHTAAAMAAGIRYIHIPFSASAPEPAAVDAFLARSRTC